MRITKDETRGWYFPMLMHIHYYDQQVKNQFSSRNREIQDDVEKGEKSEEITLYSSCWIYKNDVDDVHILYHIHIISYKHKHDSFNNNISNNIDIFTFSFDFFDFSAPFQNARKFSSVWAIFLCKLDNFIALKSQNTKLRNFSNISNRKNSKLEKSLRQRLLASETIKS